MNYPIALIDCNNFYASCERVFNPKMINKAIVVLSNNDGMIIARSKEAKKLGIEMGVPLFQIQDKIRKNEVAVFSSNYTLYGDMSERVMSTLEQFSPEVEIYSIDEAFLNLQGLEHEDLNVYAKKIKDTVQRWTGIPVSIGIGSTKTMAKIANRLAKKSKKANGLLNLYKSPYIKQALQKTKIENIWGVGRKYSKMLKKHGINTAYELSLADDRWIKKRMTVMGLRTVLELRGIPCIELDYTPSPKKAIVSSRSFGKPTDSYQDISEAMSSYLTIAASKMRKQKSAAHLISVFLRTNPFKNDLPQYHNGVLCELSLPSDSTSELLNYAHQGLKQIFKKGYKYHKVGVMLSGLIPFDHTQYTLFDTINRKKMNELTIVIDELNKKFGRDTLFYASTGIKKRWSMRSEMKSPKFTTSWEELPIAKAK